jgi:methylmalonyl-CoA mutase
MLDLLRQGGGAEIKVFGGGGGVIVADEIRELHEYGVTRIYSPEDGAAMGCRGMINDLLERADFDLGPSRRKRRARWTHCARVIGARSHE